MAAITRPCRSGSRKSPDAIRDKYRRPKRWGHALGSVHRSASDQTARLAIGPRTAKAAAAVTAARSMRPPSARSAREAADIHEGGAQGQEIRHHPESGG